MESPTIYPMRFPAIPAERRPSSIDDLLPSTYMGQPTPFDQSMKKVGQMLQAKQGDADEASKAALQFGPNVAPGQIAALNAYLFRHNPEAQQYGGVMNQQGTDALQVPGGAPVTPFNTGGQVRAQTDAEQAAAAAAKQEAAKAAQALAISKMNQQADQFKARSKQRDDAMLQQKAIANMRDHTAKQLKMASLAFQGDKLKTYQAAMGTHASAMQALSLAKTAMGTLEAKQKLYENSYDLQEKARLLEEMKPLHDLADQQNALAQSLGTQAQGVFDRLSGTQALPRVVTPPVAANPSRPNGSKWFNTSQLAAHPEAQKQIPVGQTGGWFKSDGTLDTY